MGADPGLRAVHGTGRAAFKAVPELSSAGLKQSQTITSAAINNYVRTKMLPSRAKKKYYRVHIAYLIMICTLKRSLSLSMLQTLLPGNLPEEDVHRAYSCFAQRQPLRAVFC